MKYLTLKEVAMMFGVNPYSVKRWVESGMLQAIKINGRLYIEPQKFNEFVNAHKTR